MRASLLAMPNLSRYAVYTTIAVERLETASHEDAPSEPLIERKRWVSAKALLDDAVARGEELPIIFSDSRNCIVLVLENWIGHQCRGHLVGYRYTPT